MSQHQPGPPPPPKDPAATARTRKIIIGAVAAVLVLVLGIVGVVAYQNHQAKLAAQRAEEARIAEENRQKNAAGDAVKQYYDALTAGDVDKITALTETPPAQGADLLTKEVLAEAAKKAPIKDTQVTPQSVTSTAATVGAAYTIGDKPVTTTHELTRSGDVWKLRQTSVEVNVGSSGPARQVNGKEVPAGRYRLFPGGYAITSPNPHFEVQRGEFVVESLEGPSSPPVPRVELSEAGKREAVEAAKRALNECLGRKELMPAGCPMLRWRIDDGTVPDLSSLRFTLKNDPWADARPIALGDTVRILFRSTIEVGGSGTKAGRPATLSGTAYNTNTARIDMSQTPPKVTFS